MNNFLVEFEENITFPSFLLYTRISRQYRVRLILSAILGLSTLNKYRLLNLSIRKINLECKEYYKSIPKFILNRKTETMRKNKIVTLKEILDPYKDLDDF